MQISYFWILELALEERSERTLARKNVRWASEFSGLDHMHSKDTRDVKAFHVGLV